MRILAVTNIYPSTAFPGRGVFIHEQVRGLRSIGLKVRVLFVDRQIEGPMAYYRLRDRIGSAVAELDPDAIHVMYGGVMADQIVRRHHARPMVVTFHGSDLLGENLSGWARKIISRYGVHCSRKAARRAEGVIVVARHLVRALKGVAPPENVRVIPCGIDLDRFRPMDPFVSRQQLGWNPHSFHVLFASSNDDPVKRPELARSAVAHMSHPDRLVELHYLSGISNERVPLWLNASDVLLLTSMHEGSPTVVKEALACGLPVVSVDVGDVAERLEGIEGCYLARPEPADLAAKLELVRHHRQRLDCRTRLEEFSITNVARKLKRFYEDIACRPRTSRLLSSAEFHSLPPVSPVNGEAEASPTN